MIRNIVLFGLLAVVLTAAGFGVGVLGVRAFAAATEPPVVRDADFSAIVESVGSPVVLLSTSTCPWCEKTRTWLRENRVAYRDCVVDEDVYAARLLERSGVRTVPQLITASSAVSVYDPAAFEQVVDDAPALVSSAVLPRCALPGALAATDADSDDEPAGG